MSIRPSASSALPAVSLFDYNDTSSAIPVNSGSIFLGYSDDQCTGTRTTVTTYLRVSVEGTNPTVSGYHDVSARHLTHVGKHHYSKLAYQIFERA